MGLRDRLERLERWQEPAAAPAFWTNDGTGCVRRGDQVMTEAEFSARYPGVRTFTLNIGAASLEDPHG